MISDLLDIYNRNAQTFYDYNTGQPISRRKYFILNSFCAAILSAATASSNYEFLSAILIVQSILSGFSFSVLFHLASEIPTQKDTNEKTIESTLRAERISKVKEEMFSNILYFGVVSVFCILISVIKILPVFDFFGLKYFIEKFHLSHNLDCSWYFEVRTKLNLVFGYLISFLFFIILIESMYTFIRILDRVKYYFSARIGS